MPNNRKVFVHGAVYESTFRTEEGLPFGPKPYVRVILESILARAQTLYPVKLCHFVVMANHVHMIYVVDDPKDPPEFIGYFKRESAHAINRLLGRKKHTVWADNYDQPIILNPRKLVKRIAYVYLNPSRAGLVDWIEEYPNINSWQAMLEGRLEITRPGITRDSIPTLPGRTLSLAEEQVLAAELVEGGTGSYTLKVEPFACFKSFNATKDDDPKQLLGLIVKEIKAVEAWYKRRRKRPVVGVPGLLLQPITIGHQPMKHGKRMLCLSSKRSLREAYVQWFRDLEKTAIPLRKATCHDCYLKVPPGLFAPGGFLSGSIYPPTVPTEDTVWA